MEETTQQQPHNNPAAHLAPYQFKKGQSGNPGGRPKGKSLKTYAREMIEAMDDEERQTFLEGLDKKVIWEMAEGKPEQQTDLTSKGDKIVFVPAELLHKNEISSTTPSPSTDSQ